MGTGQSTVSAPAHLGAPPGPAGTRQWRRHHRHHRHRPYRTPDARPRHRAPVNFASRLADDDWKGAEIGRGGFGVVYAMRRDPELCVKSSKQSVLCEQWGAEFKALRDVHAALAADGRYAALRSVRLVEPVAFERDAQHCYMVMPRVYRPDAAPGPTLQAQLGTDGGSEVHHGRGEFIGLAEIVNYVDLRALPAVARELGMLMGLIHYVGRHDAVDVELFLGVTDDDPTTVRFFVADFDMSKPITEFDGETIERMAWALSAVPYFPVGEAANPALADAFRSGYRSVVPREIVDALWAEL